MQALWEPAPKLIASYYCHLLIKPTKQFGQRQFHSTGFTAAVLACKADVCVATAEKGNKGWGIDTDDLEKENTVAELATVPFQNPEKREVRTAVRKGRKTPAREEKHQDASCCAK